MKQLARVTIIAETADGGTADVLIVPVAQDVGVEVEREAPDFGRRLLVSPRIERLAVSMRPLADGARGTVYTTYSVDDPEGWPTPQMVKAFKAEWYLADGEGDIGNRVRRGLLAALHAL